MGVEKDVETQCLIGVIYEQGMRTLRPNLKKPVQWYKMAAENGNEPAQKDLKRFGIAIF